MTDDERHRRPTLDRREPLRNWAKMFGGAAESGDEAPPDATVGGDAGRSAPLGDAISRSVDLGYRVVDEYIRQGQRAAQRFGDRSFSADAAVGDMREASDRMGQYASDFFGLWTEFMELTTNRDRGAPPPPAAPHEDPGSSRSAAGLPTSAGPAASTPAAVSHLGVRLEVSSVRPTEVAFDIRPDAVGRSLRVYGLRAPEADKPRLADVDLRPASGGEPARLRVRVPPGQPVGTYTGLIVDDETSAPVGTLSVRVIEADD